MKSRVIIIFLLALPCTVLRGAITLTDQSVGSMSGSMTGSGLHTESFVGLPWAASSSAGSTSESVVFPAVAAGQSPLIRIPFFVQLDKTALQPEEQFTVHCILDLSGTGLSVGGYACVLTWDTTLIKYISHEPSSAGRFIKPQVNDNLVLQGQLVFSEVEAEGDTGLINLLNVSFISREVEDSALSSLDLKLLSVNAARTYQNLSGLVDIAPANLIIKKAGIDSIPPFISGLEAISYTYDIRGPYVIKIRVDDPILSQVFLDYRKRGTTTYTSVKMSEEKGYFSGSIPGQPVGTTVEYYIEASDTMGNVSRAPADYQTTLYSFQVIIKQEPYTDANNDGKVNILDVLSLLLMARKNPNDPKLDWDGDGQFTLADAVMMLDDIMNIRHSF